MTTATATAGKKPIGAKEETKDNSGATLQQLLEYMAGGEARGKFIGGILIRVVALLGLMAMPFVIGQATKALSKLQIHLFSHMQSLSMGFFHRMPVGEILSRVTNDAEAVALFCESAVGQLVRAVLQILMILVVILPSATRTGSW